MTNKTDVSVIQKKYLRTGVEQVSLVIGNKRMVIGEGKTAAAALKDAEKVLGYASAGLAKLTTIAAAA